jgi:hypothetical protein
VPRETLYATNAVKHFKWVPRVIGCLGATAARALRQEQLVKDLALIRKALASS